MYLLIQLPKQQEIIKFSSYQMQHVQYLKCYQGSLGAILILHFICPKLMKLKARIMKRAGVFFEGWYSGCFYCTKLLPAPKLVDLRKSTLMRNKSI